MSPCSPLHASRCCRHPGTRLSWCPPPPSSPHTGSVLWRLWAPRLRPSLPGSRNHLANSPGRPAQRNQRLPVPDPTGDAVDPGFVNPAYSVHRHPSSCCFGSLRHLRLHLIRRAPFPLPVNHTACGISSIFAISGEPRRSTLQWEGDLLHRISRGLRCKETSVWPQRLSIRRSDHAHRPSLPTKPASLTFGSPKRKESNPAGICPSVGEQQLPGLS